MIKTYASLTELATMYTQTNDYTTNEKENAQQMSFDLVNSFISSEITIPYSPAFDGEGSRIPGILKVIQSKFFQYLLETSNIGYTEESQKLYDATVKMCQKLTQNEMTLPGVTHNSKDLGFKITELNCVDAKGNLYIQGGCYANLPVFYKIVITHSGTVRSGNVTYSVYRSDDLSIPLCTSQVAKYTYAPLIGTSALPANVYTIDTVMVAFDGEWTIDDFIWIEGQPYTSQNQVQKITTIKQGVVWYN